MISREEKSSATEHLNMLLDMILQYQEEKDFNIILEVLSEEFDGSLVAMISRVLLSFSTGYAKFWIADGCECLGQFH